MSSRPTYTSEQISQFYSRINLPTKWRIPAGSESRAAATSPDGYDFLSALQRHTICSIPFENLSLHYSRTKFIDIHPQLLFQKLIIQNRGGYCMENNTLFATVLRTLGFKFYSTCARVSSAASPNGDIGTNPFFYGFGHMYNIVTLGDGKRYMVDVGFGAGSCTRPLLLEDRVEQLNLRPSQSVRLRYDVLEGSENPSETKWWIWERRNGSAEEKGWVAMTCFPENVEFLPQDFEMLNRFCSTSPTTFFTQVVLCVRFVLSEDGESIVGEDIVMGGKYQKRIDGVKVEVRELKNEQERVQVLEEKFGIRLDEHQQNGILGLVSMLPS